MIFSEGKDLILNKLLNNEINLHLFSNNITPIKSNSIRHYTQPKGYTPSALYDVFWQIEDNIAYIEEEIIFNYPLEEKIYGYFTSLDAKLLWAERFKEGPYSISKVGDKIKIDIRLMIK